tara:strand:- start:39601 stop:41610 length:2010 start_codon:yes stop_codon:yes gene_type:complete
MIVRCVGLSSLFFLSALSCYASEELEPIVVEASVFEGREIDDFAQSITILNSKELEQKKSASIGETVDGELGVSSTYFAPGVSRPIIRGLGSNRVRVLENGIDSSDASSVSEDHAVSIEPYISRQIEILRGPATLRYGSGAIGGVINVVNKRLPQTLEGKSLDVDIHAEHATVSDGNTVAVDLNGVYESFAWHIDGLTRDTNDYEINGFASESEADNRGVLKNSDIENDNYGLGGAYITDAGMIGFAFSRFDSNYGIPGAEEGDIRIDLRQYRYDSQVELYQPVTGVDSISLRTTFNNYRHFEIEESGEIATAFDNEVLETRLEILTGNDNGWENAFGLNYQDREFSAVGEEAFIQPVDEKKYGVFAITDYQTGNWDFELGGRFDREKYKSENADDDEFSVFTASVGVVKEFSDHLKLNLYAARSERAPQETALYADGPHLATLTFEQGNEDIKKETSYSIELGLGQDKDNYSWQVNSYYNHIDDFIYLASVDGNNDGIADRTDEDGVFAPDGELLLGSYTNEDAKFYGIEAEVTRRVFKNHMLEVNGRVFGDYTRARFRDSSVGNVPRITPARIGAGIDAVYGQWDARLDMTYVTKQTKTAQLEETTNGFTMLDANLSKTFYIKDADVKLFLKGENLLDKGARQHASFQKDRVTLPGRNIVVGVSMAY